MNGRLYDPKLRRFIMPDNNLQDPTNSQNFNRYGYGLNNPLMYIDPSGEDGIVVIGDNPGSVGNECANCGISDTQQGLIGNFIATIANNWDNWGIKDWSHGAFNLNSWSNSIGSAGQFVGNNVASVGNFLGNNLESLAEDLGINKIGDFLNNLFGGGSKSKSPQITYEPANAYSFASGGGTSAFVTSQSTSPGGGYNSSVEMHPYVPTATIHMPTQHTFLGANMTALSEGNFFQQAIYAYANSFNIVGQYMMGRGVGDSSMRNLNGTPTRTNEATLAFGSMPLILVGGEGAGNSLKALSSTFSTKSAQFIIKNSRYLQTNNWIRLGFGRAEGSQHFMRLSIGAGKNAFENMSPGIMKNFNAWLRTLGQDGHFYFKNWKP